MTQPISSSGDTPYYPFFNNPTLGHLFKKIFSCCSEIDLARLAEVNRTFRAAVLGDEDSVRRIVLAALNQRGFHLPEIPLCLRTQLFSQRPTSPRLQELQKSLLMITREAVEKNAIPHSPINISESYRIRQIFDAQLFAGDLEGAAATIRKMSPCKASLDRSHVFPEYLSFLRDRIPSSRELLHSCPCTAYARLALAQLLSRDFENAEVTIRQITSSKFVFSISLAELAAEMAKDSSQKEKATALFQEAREKLSDHRNRFLTLRILLYIAQLEVASGLSSEKSLASAENILNEKLTFSEKLSAHIHIALTKHKLTDSPIPLSLYDSLQELPFPAKVNCFVEEGLNISMRLLPLIALYRRSSSCFAKRERGFRALVRLCFEVMMSKTVLIGHNIIQPNTFCRHANLQRLACTKAPQTVVQVTQDMKRYSAIHAALFSAIQHNRIELIKVLLTTFSEAFQGGYNPLKQAISHFFPDLFKNNPIPILSPKEILDGMQAPTTENRKSNYNRVVIAVKMVTSSLLLPCLEICAHTSLIPSTSALILCMIETRLCIPVRTQIILNHLIGSRRVRQSNN
ncbi:MAG: hypothetical protein H7A36_05145 [Chlamydiales bacterium]|nr:hypothetical protein [Chlamydiales bacterium]